MVNYAARLIVVEQLYTNMETTCYYLYLLIFLILFSPVTWSWRILHGFKRLPSCFIWLIFKFMQSQLRFVFQASQGLQQAKEFVKIKTEQWFTSPCEQMQQI